MSSSTGLLFGGFLLGLGSGWYVFSLLDVSLTVFAWLLVFVGVALVVSALFSWRRPRVRVKSLADGVIGGLVVSLFLTSGFGFLGNLWGDGGTWGPYVAEGTKTYSGRVSVSRVYLEVSNFNGPVDISTWTKSDYSVEVRIKARGTSQQEAEKNLADLQVSFTESLVQEQQRLVLGSSTHTPSRYALTVVIFLPKAADAELRLESSNGRISLKSVKGGSIWLRTSNGGLEFDEVYADTITGLTSNGPISGRLEASEVSLTTSNAKIGLVLPCTISGKYAARTSNGPIEIKVSSSANVGYDLDLSTSNGGVETDLPNLEYTLNQRTTKKARTTGYETRSIRMALFGSTSNGNIDVNR